MMIKAAYPRCLTAFNLLLVCMLLMSCTNKTPLVGVAFMSDDLYEIPDNCDFNEVYNASTQEYDCSPKLKNKFFSEFSGILINAPKKVVWPSDVSLEDFPPGPLGSTEGPLRLMVAGLVRIQYKTLGLKGDAGESVLLVAVNQKTAVSYSGKMPEPDLETEPDFDMGIPELPVSDADKNALLTSHFNFDLVHDLNIPIANATYTVYATLGDLKSNVVTIEATLKK